MVAAQQSPDSQRWADGPADAVRQWLGLLAGSAKGRAIQDVLILPSDQVYRIDLARLVHDHRKNRADISIVSHVVPEEEAGRFGILTYDKHLQVTSFNEKPNKAALQPLSTSWESVDMAFAMTQSADDDETVVPWNLRSRARAISQMVANQERQFVASAGIYLVKAKVLKNLLEPEEARNFSKDIIPEAIKQGLNVRVFPLKGYFEDIGGSIKDYYNFSIGVANGTVPFSFIDPISPIFSCPAILPPNSIQDSMIKGVQVGSGCTILRSTLTNSVIGARSQIGEGCIIQESVIMGNDYYDNETSPLPDTPPLGIGSSCHIHKSIVDKNVRIGSNVKLLNKEGITESDRIQLQGVWIRDGIIIVAKGTVLPNGFEV